MTPRRILLFVAVVLPPLVLAAIGTTHPTMLTAGSALYWRNLHIVALPIFPFLALAPWLIVRARTFWTDARWLTIAVAILCFVFAVFYTALDVLAGIGAGGLKLDGLGLSTGISVLYQLARALGGVGALAFIAACAVAGVVAIRSNGLLAVPGAVLVVAGSVLLFRDHIYYPLGVLGQVFLAAGWLGLVLASERATTAARPVLPAA